MPWTYSALKSAVAALNPAPVDLPSAVAAINGQTVTLTGQSFPLHMARLVAQESTNFSWAKILQRSEATANLVTPGPADYAVLAARTITSMPDTQTVDPSVAGAWAAWQTGIAALEAVGDLSAADVTAIGALATVIMPTWQPPVISGDVQTAEAQP